MKQTVDMLANLSGNNGQMIVEDNDPKHTSRLA